LIAAPILFFIDEEIVGSVSLLGVSLNFVEGVLRPRSLGGLILVLKLGYAKSFDFTRIENFDI